MLQFIGHSCMINCLVVFFLAMTSLLLKISSSISLRRRKLHFSAKIALIGTINSDIISDNFFNGQNQLID